MDRFLFLRPRHDAAVAANSPISLIKSVRAEVDVGETVNRYPLGDRQQLHVIFPVEKAQISVVSRGDGSFDPAEFDVFDLLKR